MPRECLRIPKNRSEEDGKRGFFNSVLWPSWVWLPGFFRKLGRSARAIEYSVDTVERGQLPPLRSPNSIAMFCALTLGYRGARRRVFSRRAGVHGKIKSLLKNLYVQLLQKGHMNVEAEVHKLLLDRSGRKRNYVHSESSVLFLSASICFFTRPA